MRMHVQTMTRLEAERILVYRPSETIYRHHPTEPDLLIVSYMYDGRPHHTLLEQGGSAFREIRLVNGRRCPLINRFQDAQEVEDFMRELAESEDPKSPSPYGFSVEPILFKSS